MTIAIQLLILLAVVAAIAVWMFRAGRKADGARTAGFAEREDLEIQELEKRFLEGGQLDPTVLRKTLNELANALDIPVGKLRPSDRFDTELAPLRGWEADDAAGLLSRMLPKHDVGNRESAPEIRTLGEFVRAAAGRDPG